MALCGGPYNNFAATREFLAQTADLKSRFCLGDICGFGPRPDQTIEMIRNSEMTCIQGNYDHAIGFAEDECGYGYGYGYGYDDPRDQKFAQISFDYSLKYAALKHREWMQTLPKQIILNMGGRKIILCHGSPAQTNEFVWESETSDAKIDHWCESLKVELICGTHSGLPWIRRTKLGNVWLNVGVLGRPAHEGKTHVYYATIEFKAGQLTPGVLEPRLIAMEYNYKEVAQVMREEKLPLEFVDSLE